MAAKSIQRFKAYQQLLLHILIVVVIINQDNFKSDFEDNFVKCLISFIWAFSFTHNFATRKTIGLITIHPSMREEQEKANMLIRFLLQ